MIRDEEKHLHDLPDSPGTMSGREALARLLCEYETEDWDCERSSRQAVRDVYLNEADWAAKVLARLGFAVLPAVPIPPGGR